MAQPQIDINNLPPDVRPYAQSLLKQMEQGDFSGFHTLTRYDYEWQPVGIRQFIEDEEYLGSVCANIHERWKIELDQIFNPANQITTAVFTGAIGVGKTTIAMICMAYVAYNLCCLRDPQSFYGLLPGSKIVLGIFNVTLTKASTGYNLLKYYLDSSPWFKQHCPRRTRPDEPIFFPDKKLSIELGSLATHALGENMFGFTMDEADFYKKTADPTEKSQAHQLFSQARTRIFSRYVQYGGTVPGLVVLLSSRRTEAHFLEQLMEDIKKDEKLRKSTHIVSFALWETKDASRFCGKTFDVLVGDDKMSSRILEEEEIVPAQYEIVKVPIEFEDPFRLDIDIALRDVAGISCAGSWNFFSDRVALTACVNHDRSSPFKVDEIHTLTLGSGNKIQDYIDIRALCDIQRSKWTPLLDTGVPRFAHIDIGLTGEALGIAIGHAVPKDDGSVGVNYDLLMRVKGRPNHEVDLTAVVEFIIYLQEVGFGFSKVTYDSYQSRHSIQLLTSRRIVAGILSVDINCYTVFKSLIMTGKAEWYNYPPFMKELRELLRDVGQKEGEGVKTDMDRPRHPPGGSDDITDAAAAVAMHVTGLAKLKKSELGDEPIHLAQPILLMGDQGGIY